MAGCGNSVKKSTAFALTEIGDSHIRINKECQDSSFASINEDMIILVVSDGHGSNDHFRSKIGSQTACDVTTEMIQRTCTTESKWYENIEKCVEELKKSIYSEWLKRIWEHHKQNCFLETELENVSERALEQYKNGDRIEKAYGCTLLFSVITPYGCLYMQIGDGCILTADQKSEYSKPVAEDEDCYMNVTSSLCNTNALDKFRYKFTTEIPKAVFLSSDGVENSFIDLEHLGAFYNTIWETFAGENELTEEQYNSEINELKEYLGKLSKKGSGDDMSVVAAFPLVTEIPQKNAMPVKTGFFKRFSNVLKTVFSKQNNTKEVPLLLANTKEPETPNGKLDCDIKQTDSKRNCKCKQENESVDEAEGGQLD